MGGKQLSFADALSDPRLGTNRRLEAIGAAIVWAPLGALAARLRPGRTGRPPYEPLVMLKALLLQRLYALSDPQLGASSFRARRRLDEKERPLPCRLSPPCRRRRGLGPDPPARADPGQSEREPRRRRPHLRRRARRLWRQGLREQGAPRPAQGARHQGSHHAPLAQEPGRPAALAGAAQRPHRPPPPRRRAPLRNLEAPARARPRPLLDACPQPRRHDRLRDRPQPAPRRRPCPGLNRAQAPNPDAVEPSSGSVLDPTALQSSPAVEPKPFRRGLLRERGSARATPPGGAIC